MRIRVSVERRFFDSRWWWSTWILTSDRAQWVLYAVAITALRKHFCERSWWLEWRHWYIWSYLTGDVRKSSKTGAMKRPAFQLSLLSSPPECVKSGELKKRVPRIYGASRCKRNTDKTQERKEWKSKEEKRKTEGEITEKMSIERARKEISLFSRQHNSTSTVPLLRDQYLNH